MPDNFLISFCASYTSSANPIKIFLCLCSVFANIPVHAAAQEDQAPLDDGDAGNSTLHHSHTPVRQTLVISLHVLVHAL